MLPTDSDSLRTAPFVLEGWRVEPGLYRIHRAGESVQIEPKVMGVLACLAAQPGDPVSRDRLMEVVWPDVIVTDDALTRCVSSLRKQFGDTPRAGRVIETIPHVGYRLSAPVTEPPLLPVMAPAESAESLDSGASATASPSPSETPRRAPERTSVLVGGAVVVGVLALVVSALALLRPAPASLTFSVRPVTALPGFETSPALAPDGEQVAFLSRESGGMALHVRGIDRTELLRLAQGGLQSPAWSPDGSRIAFARSDGETCAIVTVPALGGPETVLAPCPPRSFVLLEWSPDGAWVAASLRVDEGRTHRLHRIDAVTGDVRPLFADPSSDADDYAPRFSPDGRQIAFVRRMGDALAAVFVRSLNGDAARRITPVAAFVSGHAWAADGASVYFAARDENEPALWRVSVQGGEPQRIAEGGAAVDVRSVGSRMIVERSASDFDLMRASLTDLDVPPQPLAVSTQDDYDGVFAPGGTRLAFVSARAGSPAVWLADGAGQHPLIAADLGERTYTPAWGPSGRLVVSVYDRGTHRIAVLDAPGSSAEGSLRYLDVPGQRPGHPTWSPDGAWIAFTTETGGKNDLWRVPSGGGEAQRLTTQGGFIAAYTPDGAHLLYTKRDTPGLWSVPAEGGGETRVSSDERFVANSKSWFIAPEGSHVYAVSPGDMPAAFYRVDLGTGRAEFVRSLGERPVFGALAIHEDAIVFSRLSQLESDLFLLEPEDAR